MAGLADLFGAGRGINPALTGILAQLAPTLAQSAQRPMTPVDPTEAAINEIIQRQYTPEPVVDQPVPAQSKLWQRILSGIADAGSVYAAGISPGVRPTNFAANLMGQDYQAKDIAAGNLDRRMKARTEAERRGDELKLRQLIEKRSSEQRAADEVAKKQEKLASIAREDAIREQARQDKLAQEAKDNAYRESQAIWQRRVDQSLIDSRADRAEEVKAADKKDFQNELALLDETVNGTGNGDSLKELLDSGKISRDQAENIVLRRLKYSTLPGPLKVKYAEAINEIIGPVFAEHLANQNLAAGSPMPGPSAASDFSKDPSGYVGSAIGDRLGMGLSGAASSPAGKFVKKIIGSK